jgi:hypothetical protein
MINNYRASICGSNSRPIQGTREIRVILYAKDDPFCASAPADELSIEDVLAVEHDVIPLDGADVFQQGGIDSIGDRVALAQDPGDLPAPASRRCTLGSGSGSCRCSSAPIARGR